MDYIGEMPPIDRDESPIPRTAPAEAEERRETITLGAGCFWCVEAALQQIEGVLSVRSGYMGGAVENPTYEEVCRGTTGHAEVVQVVFDSARLPLEKLLEVFWALHDPTQLNRQGADVGTQYRSVIFWQDPEQRDIAEGSKKSLGEAGTWPDPIVTEISPVGEFWPAEEYHDDYYRQNRAQPYCQAVIAPKLHKLGLRL